MKGHKFSTAGTVNASQKDTSSKDSTMYSLAARMSLLEGDYMYCIRNRHVFYQSSHLHLSEKIRNNKGLGGMGVVRSVPRL